MRRRDPAADLQVIGAAVLGLVGAVEEQSSGPTRVRERSAPQCTSFEDEDDDEWGPLVSEGGRELSEVDCERYVGSARKYFQNVMAVSPNGF